MQLRHRRLLLAMILPPTTGWHLATIGARAPDAVTGA